MVIQLKELNNDNWLETANLSVSKEQKEFFPIPNVYWIGISRYEEHTTLYAIMLDEKIIGLIGLGYDEDGVSGFINPIMIDAKYQGNHYAKKAMTIAIDILQKNYNVTKINLGHRKSEFVALKRKGSACKAGISFSWRDTCKIKSAKHVRHEATVFWR